MNGGLKNFLCISEGQILSQKPSPQPTMRTPAENVMARALLPMAINSPSLTTFFLNQTICSAGERKKIRRTNKKTSYHLLGALTPQNLSVSDGYVQWSIGVQLSTKFVSRRIGKELFPKNIEKSGPRPQSKQLYGREMVYIYNNIVIIRMLYIYSYQLLDAY